MRFTPTSGFWRGLVEVFFGIIQRQAIKRGTFTSVKDLQPHDTSARSRPEMTSTC